MLNIMVNITSTFFAVVDETAKLPFLYGKNDCAQFVATIYRNAFGIELIKNIPAYGTKYTAYRTIVKLGGWEKLLIDRGFEKTSTPSRGDVVVCENALGVWLGNNKAIFSGGVFRSMENITAAFKYKGNTCQH